jgi:hypothetical protein
VPERNASNHASIEGHTLQIATRAVDFQPRASTAGAIGALLGHSDSASTDAIHPHHSERDNSAGRGSVVAAGWWGWWAAMDGWPDGLSLELHSLAVRFRVHSIALFIQRL